MDPESIHALSAAAKALGFVFTGLGGIGLYYSGHDKGNESRLALAEAEFKAKLSALQKINEELQERLRISEQEKEPIETEFEVMAAESSRMSLPRPSPATVKIPPLPDWGGGAVLEELIEASSVSKTVTILSDRHRRAIIASLAKYAGRSIAMHSVAGDDASFEFARMLKEVFVEAGWHVTGVDQMDYASPRTGLFITSGPQAPLEESIIPHEALTAAGFDVSRCVDSNLKGQKTVLLVGALK